MTQPHPEFDFGSIGVDAHLAAVAIHEFGLRLPHAVRAMEKAIGKAGLRANASTKSMGLRRGRAGLGAGPLAVKTQTTGKTRVTLIQAHHDPKGAVIMFDCVRGWWDPEEIDRESMTVMQVRPGGVLDVDPEQFRRVDADQV